MDAPGFDTVQLIALAGALGWASGLRVYAVLFAVGAAAWLGWIELPQGLSLLEHPLMLGASGLMLAVEFLADKVPGLDTLWDGLQTFVRIPAGAALAAGVFGYDQGTVTAVAAVLGAALAASSHAAKASTRAAVNTSPEPFSNWGLSLAEDGLSLGALWLSLANPVLFLGLLGLAVLGSLLLVWWLARFLRFVFQRLRGRSVADARGA